ncbi:MAG: glucose 1-dehydrogenase [Proteobacteria bacterium]|nr:glucose 1-dehydrogenase [Pseudomonadota bacterium]
MPEKFDPDHPLSAFEFDGDVAIVTGAARGIGYAVSHTLTTLGATVVMADLDAEAVAKAAEKLGDRAMAIECDVTIEADVERLVDKAWSDFGRLDMLVNNAGRAVRGAAVEISMAEWQSVVDVNMTAIFAVSRTAVRRHLERGDDNAVLRIVNMASIMGLSGGGLYPNQSYQATKGAVVNLTRSMAVEWAQQNVRVNALAPTWVRTEFITPLLEDPSLVERMEALMPMGRMAEPEDIAGAAMFLLSPAAAMVTGHILAVDGGYLAQ